MSVTEHIVPDPVCNTGGYDGGLAREIAAQIYAHRIETRYDEKEE